MELSLFAVLVPLFLMEVKVILFSQTKSKISEALIHTLEAIKPFEYVNPLFMACLR